jgi:hypothetical protein
MYSKHITRKINRNPQIIPTGKEGKRRKDKKKVRSKLGKKNQLFLWTRNKKK